MSEKETRFTPGPWFVTRKHDVGYRDDSDTQSYGMIIPFASIFGDRVIEDAALIAAAPDLYEALVFAKAQLEAYERAATGETYNSPLINVALSKALGETP